MDMFSLKNKTIIVSGASSGIGKQCAIELSKADANLVLLGRNKNRLNETLSCLSKGNHIMVSQDITEYEQLEDVVKTSVFTCGPISGFVHSAGMEVTLPLQSMDYKKYDKLFSLNVYSGFEIARIISKRKYSNKDGMSLVFIAVFSF
jgi:NADP-dependent 3-hydroxy acid dehydrogenase YdfG